MNKLSDIFEKHKNNIVVFIDDVRQSAYQQGISDERERIVSELEKKYNKYQEKWVIYKDSHDLKGMVDYIDAIDIVKGGKMIEIVDGKSMFNTCMNDLRECACDSNFHFDSENFELVEEVFKPLLEHMKRIVNDYDAD